MRRGACAPPKICGALRRGCVGALWVFAGVVPSAGVFLYRRSRRTVMDICDGVGCYLRSRRAGMAICDGIMHYRRRVGGYLGDGGVIQLNGSGGMPRRMLWLRDQWPRLSPGSQVK